MKFVRLFLSVFFTFSVFIFSFVSCTQATPDINYAIGSVIYMYDDAENFPEARLAIFVESKTDIHRVERIEVTCLRNDFVWIADNVIKLQKGSQEWAGYANFVMPDKMTFPQGQYKVVYVDANEDTDETIVNIAHNNSFAEKYSDEVMQEIKKNGRGNWAVYLDGDILYYYGQQKDSLSSLGGVWKKYPEAAYCREVWTTPGGGTMVIFPKLKNTEESATEESAQE